MLERISSRATLASFLIILCGVLFAPPAAAQDSAQGATPGSLGAFGAKGHARGLCPLKHTEVSASVAGFLARVTVTQEFENPFDEKIEAVYTFPLPQAAAVDDMTMRVGGRTVKGTIMRREEAGEVYRAARDAGQVASLLDQERPNVFTQSVANVMPGERVTVTISYVETLKYEAGTYEFTFPMVVGRRYIPGAAAGRKAPRGSGRQRGTDRVPDASHITPPSVARGTRAGHDISVEVTLDAGVPVEGLKSPSHEIEVERPSPSRARVRLKSRAAIPNKDFRLRYDVAGERIRDAVLTHRDSRGGYFTLILQPPRRVTVEDVTPKELVFVLDTSGSMEGFPIEKAKETMGLALDGLNPQDTFNLITFSGDTHVLFPAPVPATPANLERARAFLETRQGGGGTEMVKAVRAALAPSGEPGRVRVVCFMTDGYVGNDLEIIAEVRRHPEARVFSFGVGSSVNRFLLEQMAEQGRGEVDYVLPREDGSAAARRFHERVRNPLLTDISVDWGDLPVSDVYPKRIPDLFGARPVILSGRYGGGGQGKVRLRGRMGGQYFEREINVSLPESQPTHDVLAALWARRRVANLLGEDFDGVQRGQPREDLRESVTQLGLDYRLLTPFTSFVAVEELTFTEGGQPRRVEVPVELPAGAGASAFEGANTYPHGFTFHFSAGRTTVVTNGVVGYVMPNQSPSVTLRTEVSNAQPQPARDPGLAAVDKGRNQIEVGGARSAEAYAAAQREALILWKLHPSIVALVERLRLKEARPAAEEAKFVRDGRAEVQVWLGEKSPAALARLKELGFEVVLDPQAARLVIGRLPVEKLRALAELEAVRYVSPR